MTGLRSVFTALGGWVTVAIGVIWGLVTIWDRVANSAENAAQAQRDAIAAAKNAPTRGDVTAQEASINSRLDIYKKSIESGKAELATMKPGSWEYRRQKEMVDRFETESRTLSQTLSQVSIIGRGKTADLTQQVKQSIANQSKAGPDCSYR